MSAIIPPAGRRSLIVRLRRVEGQIRGIQAMIESGADCEQVAQQMAAARKALDRAFFATFACAIENEATGGPGRRDDGRRRLGELTELLAKLA